MNAIDSFDEQAFINKMAVLPASLWADEDAPAPVATRTPERRDRVTAHVPDQSGQGKMEDPVVALVRFMRAARRAAGLE